jgi:Fe-S oxidoreductase
MDAIVMSVLLVAALAAFGWTMYRKIKVLTLARMEVRWDRIPERIETMIRVAFAQVKLFKEPAPGLMHALIFWGFLMLLARSISLIGSAYAPSGDWNVFWFWPALSHVYTYAKDVTEAIVTVMVLYAAWRRGVTRVERLTLSGSAYLVLGFILGLMLTDFLYDGARFAAGKALAEMEWAPVGAAVSRIFTGMSKDTLGIIADASYWTHIVILLLFLNELPRSKHFHVITSIPNTFFAKLDPPGAVAPIKDIENQETFGTSRIKELTWKQIFDGYSCTECGRCTVNCPAVASKKELSPKKLICDLRDHVKKHEDALVAGKEEPEDASLVDAIGEEVAWSCTTCRSCEENCPVLLNHVDKIIDLRRRMVLMDSRYNPEVATALKNLENKSNPWGLASGDRGTWAVEMGVPMMAEKGEAEYLLFLGCFAAYDDRNKKVATALVRLLQAAKVDFAVLGPEEGCCGDPARRIGNEYLYQMQAQQNIETFKQYKAKKILTMCPHCMNTIRNEYPQFDGRFEVEHHSELLARLVRDGKIVVPGGEQAMKVTFHDSCYLGRYNGIYDAPRDVLAALPGVELAEIDRSKVNGMCCGAGGGLMFREEKHGQRMNQVRLKQLREPGAPTIASACPYCLVMLRDGINELDLGEQVKAADVAELLARRLGLDKAPDKATESEAPAPTP